MPSTLEAPVLQVDTNVIHRVDTADARNLFSMWTVFSKCADSVAQGRRLENFSWRLWNRETFCCETDDVTAVSSATSLPKDIQLPTRIPIEIPQLSGSVESVAEEEAVEFISESTPLDIIRPRILRLDSCASGRSRGRERHITSDDFEKMVVSIIEQEPCLDVPAVDVEPTQPAPQAEEKGFSPEPNLQRSGSTTTESLTKTSEEGSNDSRQASPPGVPSSHAKTTVVRGFSPSHASSFRTIQDPPKTPSTCFIPEPQASPQPQVVHPKKAKFTLGSSSGNDSLSDQTHSVDMREAAVPAPAPKRKMFQVGGSSDEDNSLRSTLSSRPTCMPAAQKKQAPHDTQKMGSVSDDDQSDTEGDYVDESAIDDDDDSSDWEDSIEDSGKSSVDERNYFQRVDSKVNLTSRRSLITLMLEQGDRPKPLGNTTSQSASAIPRSRTFHPVVSHASPNDSDDAPLMMRPSRPSQLRPINELPRSSAQPIMAAAKQAPYQAALSPKTTRRNMLATELTQSLRRQMLWERSTKSSTANAALKRRHTSHDVANLKQYPERAYVTKGEHDGNASSWDQYFNKEAFGGYHSKGW